MRTSIFVFIFFATYCRCAGNGHKPLSEVVLVASTPGDSLIKTLLALPAGVEIDFIRWDLRVKTGKDDAPTFVLNINFGIGQPNTLGFIGGGQKRRFEGNYSISKGYRDNLEAEIYHFKSGEPACAFSALKLTDNLFHLLTPDNKLMRGNGGWSYCLNRKDPLENTTGALPAFKDSVPLFDDTGFQVVFDGRTPCAVFASQYNLNAGSDCLKLKWKLTLFKDPKTLLPTTYTLKRTLHRASDIVGKCAIIKSRGSNPGALILQLDPDKPDESISFLVGDGDVLFFLDKQNRLFTGNENFSFALNRRKP